MTWINLATFPLAFAQLNRLSPTSKWSDPRGLSTPAAMVLQVFVPSRADFIESTDAHFALVLEEWLEIEHVSRHVAKTAAVSLSRHLFLVPLDDVLPIRFFTDDFAAPSRRPHGNDGLDGLWVWSNHWHRFLAWYDGVRAWHEYPSREKRVERPVSGERPGLSL